MFLPKSTKGCWTCKDRKIACDKQLPSCNKCISSGRRCLGYGVRLSWPRKGDKKRSLVSEGAHSSTSLSPLMFLQADFVNVFASDIEISHSILDSAAIQVPVYPSPSLLRNPSWTPFPLNSTEVNLFTYYQNNVAQLLTAASNTHVQNLVFRMSFTDTSLASSAILYTIYALSSLHLSKRSQALLFKSKAIDAVWTSAARDASTKDVLQRIVAVNLLALFETLATPNVSSEWAVSICYAKQAAIATFVLDQSYHGDLSLILDWVFYYDVLSKFGVRHYERRVKRMLICAKKKHLRFVEMNAPDKTIIVSTLGCSLEILSAISALIDTVLEMETDDDPRSEDLDRLERRFKYSEQDIRVENLDGPHSDDRIQKTRNVAELYRLAGLIYLHRAGRRTPLSNPVLQQLTEDAYRILETLETCERTFPLFIISCEARRDDRRAIILRLINATQNRFAPTNMLRVRSFIERFWAQEDLDVDQEIDYATKITAVLSTNNGLPAFA